MDSDGTRFAEISETTSFLHYFSQLPDHRQAGKVDYPLPEVVAGSKAGRLEQRRSGIPSPRRGLSERTRTRRSIVAQVAAANRVRFSPNSTVAMYPVPALSAVGADLLAHHLATQILFDTNQCIQK
jgi:hypothetical protein